MVYKYEKIVTTGVDGTTIRHQTSDDNEVIELGEIGGFTYISAQNGLGTQNGSLNFIKVVLVDEDIQQLKQQRHLQQLERQAENEARQLTKNYPDFEIETFWVQETEAKEYLADANALTPFLDELANQYGITKDELVQKIIAKSNQLKTASVAILANYKKVLL